MHSNADCFEISCCLQLLCYCLKVVTCHCVAAHLLHACHQTRHCLHFIRGVSCMQTHVSRVPIQVCTLTVFDCLTQNPKEGAELSLCEQVSCWACLLAGLQET